MCVCVCVCVCAQYCGDPLSLVISEAVLTVVEEEGLAARAQELGSYLRTELTSLSRRHPCIGDVRYIQHWAAGVYTLDVYTSRKRKCVIWKAGPVGRCLATKVFIGKFLAARGLGYHRVGWWWNGSWANHMTITCNWGAFDLNMAFSKNALFKSYGVVYKPWHCPAWLKHPTSTDWIKVLMTG